MLEGVLGSLLKSTGDDQLREYIPSWRTAMAGIDPNYKTSRF